MAATRASTAVVRAPIRKGGTLLRHQSVFVLSSFVVLYMAAIGFGAAKGNSAADLSSGKGDWLQQLVYFVVVSLVLWASLATSRLRAVFALPWPIVLVLAWCWLSIGWAIEPEIALRRIVLTTLIAWTVFRSVNAIDYKQPIDSARAVLILTLAANYFYVAFLPSGIHHGTDQVGGSLEGAWKGLTGHKNFAGAVCAFTVLIFAFDTGTMKSWIKYGVIAGSLAFLIMSQSKTSEAILLFAFAIGLGLRIYNPAYRSLAWVAAGVIAAAIMVFIQVHWAAIKNPFFYPNDFTNRGMIWNILFRYAKDHWLLGSGYGSFWNIGFDSPVYSYITKWQLWIAGTGSGHSGYFDLLVTIGVPGLLLAIFAVLMVPAYRLLSSRQITSPQRALMGAMLAFCAGHNLTESSLLDRDNLVSVFTFLTVALIYKVSRSRIPQLTVQPLRNTLGERDRAGAANRDLVSGRPVS